MVAGRRSRVCTILNLLCSRLASLDSMWLNQSYKKLLNKNFEGSHSLSLWESLWSLCELFLFVCFCSFNLFFSASKCCSMSCLGMRNILGLSKCFSKGNWYIMLFVELLCLMLVLFMLCTISAKQHDWVPVVESRFSSIEFWFSSNMSIAVQWDLRWEIWNSNI